MGVDLAVYRVRIGQFVPRSPVDIVSNAGYLLKAIASVRGGLARHDGLNSKGAVTFINLLLRAQGIEPNPGPGNPEKKSQEQIPDEQTDHNEDVSTPVGNNTTQVRADMINEIGESVPSVSNPPPTGSGQVDKCAGAVAIPGLPSGAIANPTAVQASNTNPLSTSIAKQIVESCLSVSNPRHSGSGQEDECAGAIAIPGSSSGAIVNPTIVQQINVEINQVNVANMNVRKAENVSAGDQTIIYSAPVSNNEDETTRKQRKRSQGQDADNENEDTPRQKKKRPKDQEADNEDEGTSKQENKSPKRILLEENAETMLKQHVEDTANLLVTRTGAEAAVIKRLKDYNMVIIAGVTGEGKTTLGNNTTPVMADMINEMLEKALSVSNPPHTGSGQVDECAGAVAIPGLSSGAIANPTVVLKVEINQVNVANMNVRKAENVSVGNQTIIYPAQVSNDQDEATPKQRKRSQGAYGSKSYQAQIGSYSSERTKEGIISDRRLTPRELGRLSRLISATSCKILFIYLGLSMPEIQITNWESPGLAGITIITKLFLKWTSLYPNQTIQHIQSALKEADLDPDLVFEVLETDDESQCFGRESIPHYGKQKRLKDELDMVADDVWNRNPSDMEMAKIVEHIGNMFFNLCLELGLSLQIIEQHEFDHTVTFSARMNALLRYWRNIFSTKATVGRLLTAMKVYDMDWHTTAQIFR